MTIDKDLVTTALAVIGALAALFQWRRDQAWKRAEKLDQFYTEFNSNRLIQIACRVMDWSRGNFKFPDGDAVSFTTDDVRKSLAVHGNDPDLTFTTTQARLRDSYDAFLGFLERLHAAVEEGLVSEKPAMTLFGYWIWHFADMPEHPACADRALRYVATYSDKSTFHTLYWKAAHRSLEKRITDLCAAGPDTSAAEASGTPQRP
jgi:hypothetical protein